VETDVEAIANDLTKIKNAEVYLQPERKEQLGGHHRHLGNAARLDLDRPYVTLSLSNAET
jgi:hypothetical protein